MNLIHAEQKLKSTKEFLRLVKPHLQKTIVKLFLHGLCAPNILFLLIKHFFPKKKLLVVFIMIEQIHLTVERERFLSS